MATSEQVGYYPCDGASVLVSPDGKTVLLELTLNSGQQKLCFGMDAKTVKKVTQDLARAASAKLGDTTVVGGTGFVGMTPVLKASASATDEVGKVALCLIDQQNLAHYFLLQTQASTDLRTRLKAAEKVADKGVRLPRA